MPQYRIQYHIARDHVVLFAVNGRVGQLLPGALSDVTDTLNLGGKANTIRLRVGDIFRLVSSTGDLSENPNAEVTDLNTGDRVITDITDQTITVDPPFAEEPNSETDAFFEFVVLRPSPFQKFTIHRADQSAFVDGTVYLNGVDADATLTNPTGEVSVLTFDGGVLTFTPIGNERWSCEMAIEVDGNIEVLIDGQDIEIVMSNMNVYQDIPIFTISDDGTRLGPWTVTRLRLAERTLGTAYVTGNPADLRLRRILIEADRERVPVGTTSEFLVVLKNRDDLERINLDGCLVTWELRDAKHRALKATGEANIVSAGLVRVEIPADAVGEGVYTLELQVNFGGNPEFILRTNPAIFYVGG